MVRKARIHPVAACGVERTTVLVVGGGPAGLAAAAELSLHGVGCVVIEPRAEVSHRRPRAKTTSIRTMEHLRRWGVADALRRAAPLPVAWSQRVTFCESLAGARITDFDGAFGLTADRDDRFAEAGQQVPQPVVEEVLREHLRGRPGTELRLGHAATSLTQDSGGVTVAVRDAAGAGYPIRARYVLGCDGAGGVVREQTGACYLGRSDPRPNFNLVFRAPGLDTHLGPAVQYWVVGAAIAGLIGRLDLSGTWWAIVPGLDAAYGAAHAAELITGLAGAPVEHEVLATDPWTARMLIADRVRDRRGVLVGGGADAEPPGGGPRLQHQRRRRGQRRLEDRRGDPGLGHRGAASQLRARAARGDRADRGQRGGQHAGRGRRAAPRRGPHPAREAGRVLQSGARARLLLRRVPGHPAGARVFGSFGSGPRRDQLHAGYPAGLPAAASLATGRLVAVRPAGPRVHPRRCRA